MPRPRPFPLAAVAVAATLVALLGWTRPASATWSIVAVDPETGLVGAAMASCVPAAVLGDPDEALVPVVLVPGTAAAVTQGAIDPEAPPQLRAALVGGAGAAEAVEALTAEDDQVIVRQYAVAVGDGSGPEAVATFTGEEVEAEVGSRAGTALGPSGAERVAATGLLLADAATVDRAFAAYAEARDRGRSMDRALADALLAGSEAGGDRRCPDDQTALFAHLAVAEPDDDPQRPSLLLTVTVDEGDGQNPVALLDTLLDEGRTGWVDAGLAGDPAGLSRTLVLVVASILAVTAVIVFRRGLGRTSARR